MTNKCWRRLMCNVFHFCTKISVCRCFKRGENMQLTPVYFYFSETHFCVMLDKWRTFLDNWTTWLLLTAWLFSINTLHGLHVFITADQSWSWQTTISTAETVHVGMKDDGTLFDLRWKLDVALFVQWDSYKWWSQLTVHLLLLHHIF